MWAGTVISVTFNEPFIYIFFFAIEFIDIKWTVLSFVKINTWELNGQLRIFTTWDLNGWEHVHTSLFIQQIIVLSSDPEMRNLS